MRLFFKYKYEIILSLLIASFVVLFSWMSIHRVLTFRSYYYDLGIMHQVVYNTAQGRILEMTNPDFLITMSRFAIHFDPLLALFAPLYWIYSGWETLLIAQAAITGLGAWAVYLIGRHIIKKKYISLIFAASYLFYFPVARQTLFDFHAVSLATPLLLFAIYFLLKNRWVWFFGMILLALLTKEHIGLVTFFLAFYLFFKKGQKHEAIGLMALGLLFFVTTVFFVIPLARQEHSFFLRYFQSNSDVSLNLFLFDPSRYTFLIRLILPYFPLVIFSPLELVIALPEIAINFASNNSNLRSYFFHYNAAIVPFILWSAIQGFSTLWRSRLSSFSKKTITAIALVLFFRSVYLYSPLPASFLRNPYPLDSLNTSKLERVRLWEARLKDEDIAVTTTPQLAPFFTARRTYYNFLFDTEFNDQGLTENDIIRDRKKYTRASYVIIAENEVKTQNKLAHRFYQDLRGNRQFKKIFDEDGIEVYKKLN